MAINPLVMMAAQNRGEPVPTALINTADKRRHRVAIDGVEGFDQQLYADLDSESRCARRSLLARGAHLRAALTRESSRSCYATLPSVARFWDGVLARVPR